MLAYHSLAKKNGTTSALYKDVREYLNINSTNLDINSETYVHANKYKSAKALSTHPSSPSSSHSSSSTPSVNYSTPISLFSTPASSQESQYSTILPQTLEEDYPIEEDPAPTLNSVNKTPIILCQPCVEEESSIDSQIVGNIVRFLSQPCAVQHTQ